MTSRIAVAVAVVATLGAAIVATLPSSAEAANVFNIRLPATESGSPCTAESVSLRGQAHLVLSVTEDAAGGFRLVFHADEHVRGSTAGGVRYVGSNTHTHRTNLTPGGTITHTDRVHLNVIRQGEGVADDDFYLHAIYHITVNANGEPTVEVDRTFVTCR